MLAYLLISLKGCDERKFLDEMLQVPQVVDAHILFGEWDIIAKVEVEDSEKLGVFMMDNIRPRNEIRITSTLIVAK